MQQQIQTNQPAELVLNEAASFFTKRRAKISDRSPRGFRFGLPGSQDSGRVTVNREGNVTTVKIEAEGLGVMAMADGYMRELRKQTRDAGRQSKAGSTGGVALSDLRSRLGMPEPRARPMPRPGQPGQPAERPASPQPAEHGVAATPTPVGTPAAMAASAEAEMPSVTGAPATPNAEVGAPTESPVATATEEVPAGSSGPTPIPGASAGPGALSVQQTAPDGPAPIEAPQISPETGPQSAPAGPASVEAPHPSFTGPISSEEESAQAAQEPEPVVDASSGAFPSAEDIGGVPEPGSVTVSTEPKLPNPGTPAGSAGSATDLGPEASVTRE
jgi:hypothetical protein